MTTLLADNIELSEQDFLRISRIMYDRYGINLHDGKKELVRARLAKRIRLSHFDSFTEYVSSVLDDPNSPEFVELVDTLTTNLTSFFREEAHFRFLKQQFVPEAQKQKKDIRRLRVWSAGCSSGEEPYSLAITLLEAFDGLEPWDIKILATDISTKVLKMAVAGVYDVRRVAPLNSQQKQRFLRSTRTGNNTRWAVGEELKAIVRFRYLNLMDKWPFAGPFDFIFCRNVMIYFDKPTQNRLVQRLADVLAPGGLIFLGHSESLAGVVNPFRYVQPTIYQKA